VSAAFAFTASSPSSLPWYFLYQYSSFFSTDP